MEDEVYLHSKFDNCKFEAKGKRKHYSEICQTSKPARQLKHAQRDARKIFQKMGVDENKNQKHH